MEHLSKSMEKYLFKMYELLKEDKLTPKKLAAALNCNRASTQEAIKHLEAKGLIDFYPYKFILLTDEGVKYAKKIEEKKEIISKFLEKFLFIEKKDLAETIDSVYFGANETLISRLNYFLDFLDFCPAGGPAWLYGFKNFLDTGEMMDSCTECIEESISDIKNIKCKICDIEKS